MCRLLTFVLYSVHVTTEVNNLIIISNNQRLCMFRGIILCKILDNCRLQFILSIIARLFTSAVTRIYFNVPRDGPHNYLFKYFEILFFMLGVNALSISFLVS